MSTTSDRETSTDQAREQVTAWLRENLPPEWVRGVESGDDALLEQARRATDSSQLLRSLGASRWAQPAWEPAYGGKGLSPAEAAAVEEVKRHHRVPRSFDVLGLGLAAPTIRQWGTEGQKQYFLTRLAQGERWCQLFSEPGNGSDVAGLATRAVRDGDEWVVNGQKVWTSGAHVAKWGMLVARSDADQPKHKGMTYFLLDMESAGVDVRPLRQITGDAEFNEVFLTDVRIPDAWRLGPEEEGWAVAQTTLMNERVALSGAFGAAPGSGGRRRQRPAAPSAGDGAGAGPGMRGGAIDDLIRLAQENGAWSDPARRDRIMQLYVQSKVSGYNTTRAGVRHRVGQPGPEGSINKLYQTEFNQRLQILAVDLLGGGGTAWNPEDSATALRIRSFLRSRGNTIEGGTSEIQRNILGDRVLGLPREPDPSRELPWKDVPRN